MILVPQIFLAVSLALHEPINRLGSPDFRTRQAAGRELTGFGEPALDYLYTTKEKHKNPEVRRRAEAVIQAIEDRVFGKPRVFSGHTGPVYSVAFSPNGRLAVSGSADGTARLWDVVSGKEVRRFAVKGDDVWHVALSPNGQRLATVGGQRKIRVWDTLTGKELQHISDTCDAVSVLCFTPDSLGLLSAGRDGSIHLWEVETGRRRFEGHQAPVSAAAFSLDGRRLLSGAGPTPGKPYDCTIRLWDVATGKELRQFGEHDAKVDGVAFLPHTSSILSTTENGRFREVRQWDMETGERTRRITLQTANPWPVLHLPAIAFSADGRRIVTGGGAYGIRHPNTQLFAVRLWNRETGAELASFLGHTADVNCVSISANGRQALSGSQDGTVRLWRLPR
jgi:WD40 repeat protein